MIMVSNLSMRFGGNLIFDDVTFRINENDRIGLVGRNGAGKSTLMKILMGYQKPETGDIAIPKETTMGYLPQELETHSDKSVLEEAKTAFRRILALEKEIADISEEMNSRQDYQSEAYLELINKLNEKQHTLQVLGGYRIEEDIERVLKGLGFEQKDMGKPVSQLSGGWQMRIELAKILLAKPSLILLDEPTNHLDIESITWLEQFLKNYGGAIMMVSHDKAFLDNITNRTIEISLGRIEDYKANYSRYVELRAERKEKQLAARKNQEREISQMERNIERFRYKASKAKFAQTLIKKLDKIDKIEIEEEDLATMNIRFPEAPRAGTVVVKAKKVSKSYGDKVVLHNVDLEMGRGEKVAFVGKNGMGKTTFSRILAEDLDHEGKVELGHNTKLAFYAQHQTESLNGDKTVLEEIEDAAAGNNDINVRGLLGAFLFSGDDVYKKIKVLSGGEKSRLALAKILLEPVNFLILDEPTNHLDMLSISVLKKALQQFNGAMIIVSHNRDFLDGLADKVYEFTKDGITQHLGGIYEFLARKEVESFREWEREKSSMAAKGSSQKLSDNKEWYKRKKELEKDVKRLKNKVNNVEREISRLEKEIEQIELRLKDPKEYEQLVKDSSFFSNYEALKEQMENSLEKWEEVSSAYTSRQGELEKLVS